MKRVIFVIAIMICVISAVYAQDNEDFVRDMFQTTGRFVGKVVYVATAGTGGEKTELVVEDERGQKMIFPLDETANMVGSAANMLTLGELKKGEKVAVEYESQPGQAPKARAVSKVE